MDKRHHQRTLTNAEMFRDANERHVRVLDGFQGHVDDLEIMCECVVSECEDMITLARGSYDEARKDPRWFLVLPEHVLAGSDDPVHQYATHWIVEKVGLSAQTTADPENGSALPA